jgi:hypothetical protein
MELFQKYCDARTVNNCAACRGDRWAFFRERREAEGNPIICPIKLAVGANRDEITSALTREKMRPPEQIPDDFEVEHERRRTRAGGCCGAPKGVGI